MERKDIIMFVLIGLLVFVVVFGVFLSEKRTNDYCKEIGYDFGGNNVGSSDTTCYKYVPHHSGVGERLVASGNIKLEDRDKYLS